MKPVFIVNAGSSSLKFSILDIESEKELVSGLAENLGLLDARIEWIIDNVEFDACFDAETKIVDIVQFIIKKIIPEIKDLKQPIAAVGHRVVHGGEKFSQPTLISDTILQELEEVSFLAPLHNPANINGIRAAMAVFSDIPHIAVFDTAFHANMPKIAFLYGLPYKFYRDHQIRRYGFHGSSHGYMLEEAAKYLDKSPQKLNIISAHLGNGASIAAIKNGVSVDTSMGMSPLDGLLMGTRSGNLDPSIIFYLQNQLGYSTKEIKDILNKQSGLYGISGISSDCRKLVAAAEKGNERAQIALDIFAYWAAKYIGSYFVPLETVDGIIFTGGIGENSWSVRSAIIKHLKAFGIYLDAEKNKQYIGRFGQISTDDSRIKALVIPTNEELMIARYTARIMKF